MKREVDKLASNALVPDYLVKRADRVKTIAAIIHVMMDDIIVTRSDAIPTQIVNLTLLRMIYLAAGGPSKNLLTMDC